MVHVATLLGYQWDWHVLFTHDSLTVLKIGVKYTLLVSSLSLVFGTGLGLIAAMMRMSGKAPFSWIAYVYIDFFRTTPALVQLIWIFYVLPIVIGIGLSPITSGVIALSLNAGAFLAEVFRSGLQSIGKGQHDAAYVLGLRSDQKWVRVIFPQAFRRVLPATGNVFIGLLKDSSLLSIVAVPELTYQTQTHVANTFRPLELYTGLAIAYFVLTYPLSLATSALERRYRVT
jgi:polar amino acid transport system permease protein